MTGCGGRKGLGAHARYCRENPSCTYARVLAGATRDVADLIGGNHPEAANYCYAAAAALAKERERVLALRQELEGV